MKSMLFTASALLAFASHAGGISGARQLELLNFLQQDCGSCHGLRMKGGLGPALLPETLAGKPRALLVDTVLEGRANTAMPPWKNLLSRDEAEWLTDRLIAGTAALEHH